MSTPDLTTQVTFGLSLLLTIFRHPTHSPGGYYEGYCAAADRLNYRMHFGEGGATQSVIVPTRMYVQKHHTSYCQAVFSQNKL